MSADEPSWWYGSEASVMTGLLQPIAAIWGWAAARRLRRAAPYRSSLPVVCVGNFTAGGTGKTPLSLHIAGLLQAAGERPAFLSRGYRGRLAGPHRVDATTDTAVDVGDEPLLLARLAPTIVSRDRAVGAAALEGAEGPKASTVIVMDDGLQNPALAKDLSVAVVDGSRGFGNGCVIPAGPLRAPLQFQLGIVDAIVVNRPRNKQSESKELVVNLRQRFAGPVMEAWVEPTSHWDALRGKRVVVLSGIAGPHRFFRMLLDMGIEIADRLIYPDHHTFTQSDARTAMDRATELGAILVTTEKDWVRLVGGSGALAELRQHVRALPIAMAMDEIDAAQLSALIAAALARKRVGGLR